MSDDTLKRQLQIAIEALKWIEYEGHKHVPSHWKDIALFQTNCAKDALAKIKSGEQVLDTPKSEERYRKVIQDWKFYWMNKEEGYFERAFRIDANMMHHLCSLLMDSEKESPRD